MVFRLAKEKTIHIDLINNDPEPSEQYNVLRNVEMYPSVSVKSHVKIIVLQ